MEFRVSVLRKTFGHLVESDALRRPLAMLARSVFHVTAVDAARHRWKFREARQTGVEQSHAAAERAALEVVISRGNLNQPLQKLIEIRFGSEPELLPGLVGLPEFEGVEVFDSTPERRFKFGPH